jgi:hypothetical protein
VRLLQDWRVRELVERGVVVVELDLGHLEAVAPLGLVPQTILERTLGVFLGDEELYRFRVVKLGERVQTHRIGNRIRLAPTDQQL